MNPLPTQIAGATMTLWRWRGGCFPRPTRRRRCGVDGAWWRSSHRLAPLRGQAPRLGQAQRHRETRVFGNGRTAGFHYRLAGLSALSAPSCGAAKPHPRSGGRLNIRQGRDYSVGLSTATTESAQVDIPVPTFLVVEESIPPRALHPSANAILDFAPTMRTVESLSIADYGVRHTITF